MHMRRLSAISPVVLAVPLLLSSCSTDDGTAAADPVTVVRTSVETVLVTQTPPAPAPATVTRTVQLRPPTVTKTVRVVPHTPEPKQLARHKPPAPAKPSCASGYSPCLAITGDLDCGDISDALKPIHVTGSDPRAASKSCFTRSAAV